jgi:VWFA-related protein
MAESWRFAIFPLLLVALASSPRAEFKPQAQPQFRTATDLVRLDVSVLDRSGRTVRGLSASDFTVLEDGRAQPIQAFTEIIVPGIGRSIPWAARVIPDVRRNDDSADRRLWVIVLDDATIPPSPLFVRNTKQIARRIVERMGPADRAAIVFTRDNRNAQDFTDSQARLTAAIETFTSGFNFTGRLGGRGSPDDYWYESSINTVATAAKYLADLPDRRKVLVYISIGLPIDTGALGSVQIARGGLTATESMRRLAQITAQGLRDAQLANVSVYAIDPGGLGGLTGYLTANRRMRQVDALVRARNHTDFLRTVAENTGGRAIVETNDSDDGIAQMFAENDSYYLVGFQPTNARAEGRFRRVDVRVGRPDVEVRARRGYYERPQAEEKAAPTASVPLTMAMAGLLPVGGLPLQVTAVAIPSSDARRTSLAVVVGVRGDLLGSSGQQLSVAVRAFTPEGQERAAEELKASVRPESGTNGDLQCELLSRLTLAPGRYQVRVAAQLGPNGATGSVYHDVDVPDPSRSPISLAGVALSREGGVPAIPSDRFRDVMPIVPTTQRTFRKTDRVRGFLQVYQGRGAPDRVVVASSVQNANGNVVWQDSRALEAAAFATTRAAPFEFELPLTSLGTGLHLLTVEATRGRDAARQHVQFEVR